MEENDEEQNYREAGLEGIRTKCKKQAQEKYTRRSRTGRKQNEKEAGREGSRTRKKQGEKVVLMT